MEAFIYLIIILFVILLLRFVGAWMLRINDVITRLDEIVKLLKESDR